MNTEASPSHDALSLRRSIDLRLRQVLPTPKASTQLVHSAMNYAVEGGHRWRPLLLISAFQESSGNDAFDVIDAACAIELIHCCTIILDDLPFVDNATLRRGKSSCHKVYGEAITIYASHLLYALAESLACKNAVRLGVEERYIRDHLYNLRERLIDAQVLEINLGRRLVLSDDTTLRQLYELKSSLFSSAAWLGSTFAQAKIDTISHIHGYGTYLGMAYQLADDVADVTGDAQTMGKHVGMDRSKINFVTLLGVPNTEKLLKSYWERAISCLERLSGSTTFLRDVGIQILNST